MKELLLCWLVISTSLVFGNSISLTKLSVKNLNYTDRLLNYFSDFPIRSYKLGSLEYQFILDTESPEVDAFVRDIEEFGNLEINTPNKVGNLDFNPVIEKLFPNLNIKKAPILNSYNCHNTTLLTQGFLSKQSYSDEQEIKFFMENFCEEVNQLEKNTVAVFYHGMLSHSFTAVSDRYIFEKPSNHIKTPYRFKRISNQEKVKGYSTLKNFHFYKCNSSKFTSLTCQSLSSMRRELQIIDKYFSKLASSLKDATERKIYFKHLKDLEQKLFKLNPNNIDCNLIRESMFKRINSLKAFYDDMNAGGIYGHGSYGGSGPRY